MESWEQLGWQSARLPRFQQVSEEVEKVFSLVEQLRTSW